MTEQEYKIVRSNRRKTMSIVIDEDGEVIVRIPRWVSKEAVEEFVEEKEDWIRDSKEKMINRKKRSESRNWSAVREETYPWIRGLGGELFRKKVAQWAEIMGVEYNRITIKEVSTRWASCSSKKNLNFSWKVFVMPERLVDYLIVHELSHLKYMNHSEAFWDVVRTYIPEYKPLIKELENYV